AGRGGFHEVLRVEVRPRAVGRSARMDDGELTRCPERLEGAEARVQAEEAVELERAVLAIVRPRDRDARPRRVIRRIAVRDDEVEAVDGAALENRDQAPGASGPVVPRRRGGMRGERGREAEADEGERAVLQKPPGGTHGHRLWNSGEPSCSARC